MQGTQVTDIEKKVDYPKFKKCIKLKTETSNDITEVLSDNIESENVNSLLAAKISSNMKAESEAIEFYNELLNDPGLTEEDKEQIREFISDEKNHLQGLSEMLKHYDGNIKAAID